MYRSSQIITRSAARDLGIRDALGVPAAVLAAGMLGFGALAFESGLNLALALACTAGIWALPGQIVLIEMHVAGAPGALTILAVMLTGARGCGCDHGDQRRARRLNYNTNDE